LQAIAFLFLLAARRQIVEHCLTFVFCRAFGCARLPRGRRKEVSMVSKETDPSIDLRHLERLGLRLPVLICLGGGGTPGARPAAALIDIQRRLEIGRGPAQPPAPRRFQTNDPLMSRRHAELVARADGSVLMHDLDSSNGTWLDGQRLFGAAVLHDGAVLFAGSHVFVMRMVTPAERAAIEEELTSPFGPTPTLSPAGATLMRQLRQLAPSDLDLLLGGETGVGKEVYAQAIHRASGRVGAFVVINCAALPESLIESELFGYARGAHSMAEHNKPGLLEQAHGGTLFLDEIGDMPTGAQSKLLRFLQDGTFTALGAVRARRVDVRVIAATRQPVTDVGRGLRVDLAARLGPQALVIPPLRDRVEDLGPLVGGFLRNHPAVLEPLAWRALFLHRWPGNVRELQKTVRFALVVSGAQNSMGLQHLPPGLAPAAAVSRPAPFPVTPLQTSTQALRPARPSKQALMEQLRRSGGDVALAARAMGRQRTLVWRWLRQHGVDPQQYRSADPDQTGVQCEDDGAPDPRPPDPTAPLPTVKGRFSGEA
jgi:DNA-binding NtrC family response regulator